MYRYKDIDGPFHIYVHVHDIVLNAVGRSVMSTIMYINKTLAISVGESCDSLE